MSLYGFGFWGFAERVILGHRGFPAERLGGLGCFRAVRKTRLCKDER